MALLSYTQRREYSGRYVMRKSLPKSLAGKPVPDFIRRRFGDELVNVETGCFKREVKISARTADPEAAKRHSLREAARISQLIADVERATEAGPQQRADSARPSLSPLTDNAIQEIVSAVQGEYWNADDDNRTGPDERLDRLDERGPDLVALTKGPGEGMEEDAYLALGDLVEDDLAILRAANARGDASGIVQVARRNARALGYDYDGLDEVTMRRLNLAALRGAVEITERIAERHQGRPVGFQPVKPKQLGPKLSEAFERWKAGDGGRDGKKRAANTILEAGVAVRQFTELHGDLKLGEITKAQARDYRDVIAKVPKNLPNALRVLPIKTLIKKDLSTFELRSAATLNKSLTMLEAIVQQAIRDGYMDEVAVFSNPFSGLRFSKDDRFDEKRKVFEPSDLERLFNTDIYRANRRPRGGGGEAAFWFPLITLFSGMRQSEVAGLRVGDLRPDQTTGIWLFDVRPTEERGVKTASSIRQVPVHSELIRIGLLRYRELAVQRGQAAGLGDDAPLWPDLTHTTQRLAAPWSKWFGRYLREEVGINDPLKVFHSTRHTFKRVARDADLAEEKHDALTGHAGSGSVGRGYGRGFGIKALSAGMKKVTVPVDLSWLTWSPGEVPPRKEAKPPRPMLRRKPIAAAKRKS